jgi:Domain of unknown function (DUF929)
VTGKPGSAGREIDVPGTAQTPDQDSVFSEPRAFSQLDGGQNASKSPYDMSMGKASRTKGDSDRRARIAQQREAERRAAQRKRIYWAGGSILVVAIVVIALVLVKLNTGSSSAPTAPTGTALASVTKQVTDVPVSVTDQVAAGGVPNGLFVSAPTSADISTASTKLGSYFATVNGTALTSAGKPEVLFIGGEYCPFCAAQRWAIVNSLSRFGTFTGLKTTHSSSTDTDPNTPSFTFYGSKYTSDYIAFTSVEEYTNTPNGSGGYTTLQTPTAAQQAIGQAYDPSGSIPFFSLANKYVQVGNLSPLSPTLLAGQTWAQIAAAMNDPSSKIGQAIIGNANFMTAGICKVIDNKSTSACTPTIQKLEATLAS